MGQSPETEGDQLSREDRLRELYETHADRVLAFAARRTDRDAARDVVSQTFLIAWRRIDDVPAEPIPWLLGVARRVLANERRATSRRAALIDRVSLDTGDEADPSDAVAGRERALKALEQLSHWDREALMLMAWERLDYKSAAAIMRCPPTVFKVRLHRARSKLARALEAENHEDTERSMFASKPQEAK